MCSHFSRVYGHLARIQAMAGGTPAHPTLYPKCEPLRRRETLPFHSFPSALSGAPETRAQATFKPALRPARDADADAGYPRGQATFKPA